MILILIRIELYGMRFYIKIKILIKIKSSVIFKLLFSNFEHSLTTN